MENNIEEKAKEYAKQWKTDMGEMWGYSAIHYKNGHKACLEDMVKVIEEERQQVTLDLLNNGNDDLEKEMLIELRVFTDLLTKLKTQQK